jgi:hypothetical protein
MKSTKLTLAFAMAAMAVLSCETNSASYTYLYCINCSDAQNNCMTDQQQCGGGCTTGRHNFDNKDDYCKALKDNSLNNSCDADSRKSSFQQNGCSGSFDS